MLYRNLFVWVVHKGLSFFHGFVFYIRQHDCSWISYAANLRNIAEPCASRADFYHLSRNAYRSNDLRDKMLQSTIPRTMRCFDDCRACKVLVQTYKNISGGGLNPLYPLLNTALQENVASSVSVEKKSNLSFIETKRTQIALILRRLKTKKSKYFS